MKFYGLRLLEFEGLKGPERVQRSLRIAPCGNLRCKLTTAKGLLSHMVVLFSFMVILWVTLKPKSSKDEDEVHTGITCSGLLGGALGDSRGRRQGLRRVPLGEAQQSKNRAGFRMQGPGPEDETSQPCGHVVTRGAKRQITRLTGTPPDRAYARQRSVVPALTGIES